MKANASDGMIFERHEKKFLMHSGTYYELMDRLTPHMEQDAYGLHTINTIYFDTEDYSIIRHSLDKPKFKVKLRLRSYGTPGEGDPVYLELKKKLAGITYKRRVAMPLRQARDYLDRGVIPPESGQNRQTFGEIDWFIQEKNPSPKVLLCYDRIAMYGREDRDFRMTFDANIRWRSEYLDLGKGDNGSLLLLPGDRLLEVKTLRALPLWLCHILSELEIYPISLSKYGTVYEKYLMQTASEVILSA